MRVWVDEGSERWWSEKIADGVCGRTGLDAAGKRQAAELHLSA